MDRPRVIIHSVASADGRITLAPGVLLLHSGERWCQVAGTESPIAPLLRSLHSPQANLEGSGSFVGDDYEPEPLPPVNGDANALYVDFLPDAVVKRPGHRGWFIVVDGRGRVRWFYKEFPSDEWAGWHLLILAARSTPAEYLAYLQRENIPYLVAGDAHVDLAAALAKMKSQLGVTSLISTTGARLSGVLLRAGLVDEINIELFPAIIGGSETPAMFGGPPLGPDDLPTRLRLLSAEVQHDGRIWLRYEVTVGDPA